MPGRAGNAAILSYISAARVLLVSLSLWAASVKIPRAVDNLEQIMYN
ncbi:MAG: hypothetical protein UY92_C0006G0127 [Candidatus Magasanikbacteria bacterium GW2011_GWA2_56_11]|uniref:Uncharacterized protein n=1 Tax=Candidatus Magasanikbacteria bacterium GW2011_GWA2_56_11 TaxID=1619044 RepID=A0A0G1YH47_9BACT|nr:MAG: hypothetical protein UY92_C0006G0127 [Candidatus Magasanikbacteria bacterium GW2011_GWA2_56_11]